MSFVHETNNSAERGLDPTLINPVEGPRLKRFRTQTT